MIFALNYGEYRMCPWVAGPATHTVLVVALITPYLIDCHHFYYYFRSVWRRTGPSAARWRVLNTLWIRPKPPTVDLSLTTRYECNITFLSFLFHIVPFLGSILVHVMFVLCLSGTKCSYLSSGAFFLALHHLYSFSTSHFPLRLVKQTLTGGRREAGDPPAALSGPDHSLLGHLQSDEHSLPEPRYLLVVVVLSCPDVIFGFVLRNVACCAVFELLPSTVAVSKLRSLFYFF